MNNPQLDQAREWARDNLDGGYFHGGDRVLAAAKIIQSLPDEWIDAEKVRELIDAYKHARDGNAAGTEGWVMNHLVVRNLESLLPAPQLPTLHELARELEKDPEDYRWMQAKTFHTGELGCITDFDLYREVSTVLFPNGVMKNVQWEDITPLPDLPRLEWPAQAPRNPETPPAETLNNTSSDTPRNPRPKWGPITLTPPTREEEDEVRKQFEEPALPRPEDVPAGEPWIVRYDGEEWAGVRADEDWGPWHIISMDGMDYQDVDDSDITLVSRLVPEDKP